MKTTLLLSLAATLLIAASTQAADNMKAFPAAEEGMSRYVLNVPKKEDESTLRVELLVGKTVETDAHNQFFFGGELVEETIEGWGFPKFVLSKLGPMAGTLMAVEPAAPKVKRFITLGGEPRLLRYNSRLPMVVYVPEGVEVRYRIWTACDGVNTMPEG